MRTDQLKSRSSAKGKRRLYRLDLTVKASSFIGLALLIFSANKTYASVICGTTAACAGTTRNWVPDAATTTFFDSNNWRDEVSGNHSADPPTNTGTIPNTNTENACIRSDFQTPDFLPASSPTVIRCLEISSGLWNPKPASATTLSITGNYFRNLNAGSMNTNNNLTISMDGTAAQTFENMDGIANFAITNAVSVELTQAFAVSGSMTLSAGVGKVYIDKAVSLPAGSALVIPSSATVEIKAGGSLVANGGITVNGVLKVDAGGSVLVGNGKSLTVLSGGLLQLAGSAGNPATLDAVQAGSNAYNVTINSGGAFNGSNFLMSRMTAAGLNVSGTIQAILNGEFHYIASGGYGITLNGGLTSPSTWTGIGFFDDASTGAAHNFNVSSYTGSIINLNNWSGLGGGSSPVPGNYSNPVNSVKLNWQTQAGVVLQLTNNTVAGSPPSSLGVSSADTLFSTFAFSLNQAATGTNVSSVKLTVDGTNNAADVSAMKVYTRPGTSDCTFNTGVDTLIATLTPTGSPPSATVNLSAGQLAPSGTTPVCMHVTLATGATAQNNDTLSVKIASNVDVVNSQTYSFSNTALPPVQGGFSTITTGTTLSSWNGGNGTADANQNWNANAADWTPNGTPPTIAPFNDCQIGSGYSILSLNISPTCVNLSLPSNGRLDWGNAARTFSVQGSFTLGSGYTFTGTLATSVLNFSGSTANQGISAQTTFPGSVVINNTGAGKSVYLNTDWTIGSNFTLTAGNFVITSGHTLTVGGNVAVNGGTFTIQPGATLKFSTNGRTMTVASGATLQIVGSGSQNANITSSSTATAYTVSIAAGAFIQAQYYSFSNLGTPGLTISGNINAANHLQNGTFTCPIGSGILLKLNQRIPGDAMANMTFDRAGCSASATSIDTSGAPTYAPGLQVTQYSGNLTNCCSSAGAPYPVAWSVPQNTLNVVQATTGPASLNQGDTAKVMGMFRFQQTAGGSSTTNLNSVQITLTGTGTSSDITAAKLWYDSTCAGSGGVQLGSTLTFFGSPPTANFTSFGTNAPITTAGTPCLRLEYDIASGATAGDTVGAQIVAASDVTNSLNYAFSGSAAPPVNLGNPSIINGNTITWVGGGAPNPTFWDQANNWNLNRIPTLTDTCVINSVTNNPVIRVAGAVCKTVNIGNGSLTINAGQNLDFYGSFLNTGTFNNSGTLTIRDTGSASNQTISSSSAIPGLLFNKTLGGFILIGGGNLTLSTLTIPAGQNFTFKVQSGDTLTLPAGMSLASATMQMGQNSALMIGSAQGITVSGTGTFQAAATSSAYNYSPAGQTYANSAWIAPTVAGNRWYYTQTAGTADLTGLIVDSIDANGLNFSGTSAVTHLDGVQFLNLNPVPGLVAALQFKNTGGILTGAPAYQANNVGFNFGTTLNSYYALPATPAPPAPATAYNLIVSSGSCSNTGTIIFRQWFGDFSQSSSMPDPSTKKSAVAGCPITFATADSPVSLTQFTATPYRDAVVLKWTTGAEWQHQGFNVYRSGKPDGGYAQINGALLRNSQASGSIHGQYQFYDKSIIPGVTYYYEIEDFAVNGVRTMHGPLSATPQMALAIAPAPDGSSIASGTQTTAPTGVAASSGVQFSPGQEILAPGVTLLARTAHSLRVQIDVPAFTTAPAEQGAYVRLTLPSYSLATDAGFPELPTRIVMLEVPTSGAASFAVVSQTHSSVASLNVAPAPLWTVVNGQLTSTWAINSAFYATNQILPSAPLSLGQLTQNQGRTYLPLAIQPLAFNPVAQNGDFTTQLIVDIDLAGAPAWNLGGAVGTQGPWSFEGGLKLNITHDGLYQIGFNDLVASGLDGPFKGVDSTKLRLFYHATEVPIEVHSAGSFGAGDFIRFYAPYTESYESDQNTLLLIVDSVPGIRIPATSAAPGAIPKGRVGRYLKTITVKNPKLAYFDVPYAENKDHLVWGKFFTPISNPGDDTLTANFNLPNLSTDGLVTITAQLKGSPGATYSNGVHHIRLVVNGVARPDQDAFISVNTPTTSTFTFPASLFLGGANQIQFVELGDLYGGDYDIMTLVDFAVTYPHLWVADSDLSDLTDSQTGNTITVTGFGGSDLVAYDVTDPVQTQNLSGLVIGPDGMGGFSAHFVAAPDVSSHRILLTRASAIPLPRSIALNFGSALHSTSLGADVLFIGTASLLDAAAPLINLRASQGFRVQAVNLEDIYSEFGLGDRTAETIKSFIQYASTQWSAPALKYVVLVGDGNYDLKNELGYASTNNVPIHLLKGYFLDYASDNWFVSFNANDSLPALAIGRIPGATPELIATYVNKVLGYESGALRPLANAPAQMSLISDRDQYGGEKFSSTATALSAQIGNWNSALKVSQIQRDSLSDTQLRAGIFNAFSSGPTLIHYLGHGAENEWAGSNIFTNADADTLSNQKLPIVVSMSCLNGFYYEADPTSPVFQSLSDRLLFNPNGGAAAMWVSTSFSNPQSQLPYQSALYQILAKNPGIRLGDAILQAKLQGGYSTDRAEVINSWTLLGDPMLQVNFPAPQPAPAADAPQASGGGCGTPYSTGKNAPNPYAPIEFLVLLLTMAGATFAGRSRKS